MRAAWRAFGNMLEQAKHDPVWALYSLIVGPFRAIRYLEKTFFAIVIVAVVVYGLHAYLGLEHPYIWLLSSIIIVGVVLVLGFRFATNPIILHFGDLDGETHGTARFSTDRETAAMARKATEGLLIGRDHKSGKLLRYAGPSHLLTMAPTRTGKGVGTIVPNLLTADRSVICVDPKGENATITARARQTFGPVHVLDPFAVTNGPGAAYNPLDRLDPANIDVAEDASTLADALVYDEPGMSSEAHWNEEAKALIGGLLLHIAAHEPPERRTLSTLREALTLPADAFSALLAAMQGSPEAGGLIARAANRHLGKSDREGAGVLSAAQRHTHFLDSPRMTRVLARSDFSFADLKRQVATVFLVLPPDRLSTYSRWLRLLISQSLTDMARTPTPTTNPLIVRCSTCSTSSPRLAISHPSSVPWASWQVTVSSSGPSSRMFISSAPHMASEPARSSRTRPSCKSSVSTITKAPV